MSAEMVTTIVGFSTILVTFLSLCVYTVHRMDKAADRLCARIDGVNGDPGAQPRGVRDDLNVTRNDLGARIDKVADELVEVKIAVARVEGQQRHPFTGR